jgi:electron transport complex protein RnfE
MREFLGQGTLFSGLNLIFGDTFNSNGLSFFDQYEGFLLAILPPGAFLGLAFMIAFMNWVNQKN